MKQVATKAVLYLPKNNLPGIFYQICRNKNQKRPLIKQKEPTKANLETEMLS
jgi:hypothetical protein